jgi:CubicO group peptidase (beta-lactamase class C family)
MRRGNLILEEYFNGSFAGELHTAQSVTKSFASAAIGMAISEGLIDGVDENVVDFFPAKRDSLVLDDRRARMKLEDILTMRTGTDYHENGPTSPHARLNALTSGWDDFWLDRPMVNEPGSAWQYDSGGVVTLSSIIKERYGEHADVFLRTKLFDALGFGGVKWTRNLEQHPHTGGGLFLTAKNMLSFGQLYLQNGLWNGNQLVPKEWIDASLSPQELFDSPRGASGKAIGYGYLWWLLEPDPAGTKTEYIYGALGYRGQYIFVIPEHEMVVVVTAWMPPELQSEPISFLYSTILPAIVS